MQETPPPSPAPRAPKLAMAKPWAPRANPDLVVWAGGKKAASARATREEDLVTPPPVGKARRPIGPPLRRLK
jgi:hypothetical protein